MQIPHYRSGRNHFAVEREFTADKSEFVETLGKFDGVAEFVVFL